MKNYFKNPKIIILSIFALIIVIILSVFLINQKSQKPQDEIQIPDLIKQAKKRKIDSKPLSFLQKNLFTRVKNNYKSDFNPNSTTTKIRESSFQESYDSKTDLHTIRFIVDIESIKQSYQGFYQWSKNSHLIDGYANQISCLPKKQLIYDYFVCQDLFSQQNQTISDPIYYLTPYQNYNHGYNITADKVQDPNQKITIRIEILSNDPKRIQILKDQALDFLKHRQINLEDYQIIFH